MFDFGTLTLKLKLMNLIVFFCWGKWIW